MSAEGQQHALRDAARDGSVPHRARGGLEALSRACRAEVDDVVEQEMPLIEGIVLTGKPDRAATVLGKKVRCGFQSR